MRQKHKLQPVVKTTSFKSKNPEPAISESVSFPSLSSLMSAYHAAAYATSKTAVCRLEESYFDLFNATELAGEEDSYVGNWR